ncbi:MAG: NAD-glutamate dehydrogenase domain-containing protein, partial [Thermoleophilaceae bacterium]
MSVKDTDETLIDEVCSRVRELVADDGADDAEAFVRQFYRWVSPDDLVDRDALDLYGLAVGQLGFARERRPGETKIRVYNPQFETHGWQSTHTAVEIVTDDKPFLIDSISMELNRRGFGVHLIIHPVMNVRRDDAGRLLEVIPVTGDEDGGEDLIGESVIHAEVDRHTDPAQLEELRGHLMRVIGEVRAAVDDWRQMRARALELAAELRDEPPVGLDPEEVSEARAFLEWLEDHNFTFLGYRDYELATEEDEVRLRAVPDSGLGILRQAGGEATSRAFEKLPPEVRKLALEPHLLNLTKANSRATVHRPSYLDYVGVKRFDADGEVVGERRFLGLYTHTAYQSRLGEIPILRRKVDAVLKHAAFPHGSHNEKALIEILEAHPRDELIQVSADELFETAMGILHLGERQRLRLFVRRDRFGRFFSCLVFVPRDRFNTENRRRIEAILRDVTDAKSIDYTTRVSESVLVRLHYMAYTEPGHRPNVDARAVEVLLVAATRSWADDFEQALVEEQGEERGRELFRRYGDAFPTAYRADWVARSAIADIRHIEDLPYRQGLEISLYRPLEAGPGVLRAKLYRSGRPLALSDVLPLFENMGVQVADERPYAVRPRDGEGVWIYDFGLVRRGAGDPDADGVREAFHETFIQTWRGDIENDGYNRLVLGAGLTSRQVTVLRAVARYLRQTGMTFSDRYVEHVLVDHPQVAAMLIELFEALFEPDSADETTAEAVATRVEAAIDAVESLDQDQILRRFLDVVRAMLRTNFFQHADGGATPKPYVSFKLDPSRLGWLPEPKPA